MNKYVAAALFIAALLISALITAIITQYTLHTYNEHLINTGLVAYSIDVHWNLDKTNKTEQIDWGTLVPASSKTVTVYATTKSTCRLAISTANWTPPHSTTHLTFTWSYNMSTQPPAVTFPVNLTLTVSPSIQNVTDFGFTIIMYTLEQAEIQA